MNARYVVGDVFEVLASLEPGSVDLVMTSPPFLALRSYLPADHEQKHREIGSEATPGEFLDVMLDVVEACDRVLAPHGSLVFELGDTYAGSGGAGGDYNDGGLRDGAPKFAGSKRAAGGDGMASVVSGACDSGGDFTPATPRVRNRARDRRPGREDTATAWTPEPVHAGGHGWPLDKSKVLVPQLFAVALAYGFNPLTGRKTEPWRVRNTVAWCRPNPPVGRDGDKFRPATSFLTVACKARDRYWDGDAVRTAPSQASLDASGTTGVQSVDGGTRMGRRYDERVASNPAGAPLLDWWEIPTQPYAGSHYATYPANLVVPIVKSMCPARVCRVCGKPSRRITGEPEYVQSRNGGVPATMDFREGAMVGGEMPHKDGGGMRRRSVDGVKTPITRGQGDSSVVMRVETLGWSDCGHNDWRNGVVLDPFAGSGTSLQVATGHGRDAIGIDLDERNAELAFERIGGLFLEVERFVKEGAA